jgi:hypothetical protein
MIMDRNMKLKIAAFACIIILLYFSIPLTVITLIIGLLFIPPVAVIAYIFLLGISMIRRELVAVLSGKDFFLISVSKEYITLEPQFR